MHNSTNLRPYLAPILLVALLLGGVRLAQAQSADAGPTIARWNATNATCRNVGVPALEAIGASDDLTHAASALERLECELERLLAELSPVSVSLSS